MWGVLMKRRLFGNVAVSLIVCTLGAIAGIAMMALAGSAIRDDGEDE
jgi:hypothetical protein